jgi:hypothetical protein
MYYIVASCCTLHLLLNVAGSTILRATWLSIKLNKLFILNKLFFFFFFYGATARYRALASLIKPLHSRLDSRFRDTYYFFFLR